MHCNVLLGGCAGRDQWARRHQQWRHAGIPYINTATNYNATRFTILQHTTPHLQWADCNAQDAVERELYKTATHYSTLQHTATHCNTLQHPFNELVDLAKHTTMRHENSATLQYTATHLSKLQRTGTHCNALRQYAATQCNTQHTGRHGVRAVPQRTATALQYAATNNAETCELYNTATHGKKTATHCNTLQQTTRRTPRRASSSHTAAHCNDAATHCNTQHTGC